MTAKVIDLATVTRLARCMPREVTTAEWDAFYMDRASAKRYPGQLNGYLATDIRAGRAGSIRAALCILVFIAGLWGGMKLEQWATTHNAARVETLP